jgi:hypothetical protein
VLVHPSRLSLPVLYRIKSTMRALVFLIVIVNIILGFSQEDTNVTCRKRVQELCHPCGLDRQCWRSCVIQNVEELRGLGCQAPNSLESHVVSQGRELLIGPRWTWDAKFEKPLENQNMGTWTATVYSKEQQQRLGVDEWGHPATRKSDQETDSEPSKMKPKSKSKSKSKSKIDAPMFGSTSSLRHGSSNNIIDSFGKRTHPHHPDPANDDYYYSMPLPDVVPGDPYTPPQDGPPTNAPTYMEYPPGKVVPIPPSRKLMDEFDWGRVKGKSKSKYRPDYTAPDSPPRADSRNVFGAFSSGSDDGDYSYRFSDRSDDGEFDDDYRFVPKKSKHAKKLRPAADPVDAFGALSSGSADGEVNDDYRFAPKKSKHGKKHHPAPF